MLISKTGGMSSFENGDPRLVVSNAIQIIWIKRALKFLIESLNFPIWIVRDTLHSNI